MRKKIGKSVLRNLLEQLARLKLGEVPKRTSLVRVVAAGPTGLRRRVGLLRSFSCVSLRPQPEGCDYQNERAKKFKEVKKMRKKIIGREWKNLLLQLAGLSAGMALVLVLFQGPVFAEDIENKLGTSDGTTAFQIKDSGGVGVAQIDSDGNLQIKGGMRLDSGGAECTTSENLIIDGNVAIGTPSPQGKLHILSNSTTDPYVFVTSHTTTGFGIVVSTGGRVGIGNQTPTAPLHVTKDDASASSVTDLLILEHTTTGSPAVNIGAGLVFNVERLGGSEEQASIDTVLTDASSSSRTAEMVFNLRKEDTIYRSMAIRPYTISLSSPMATPTLIKGNILREDDSWIGLGSASGRIEFNDQTVNILDASVGIGTTTPQGLLNVVGGSVRVGTLASDCDVSILDNHNLNFLPQFSNESSITSSYSLKISAGGGYMFITDDGNFGIDTESPQGKLHILSNSTTDPYVFVTSHTITGFGVVVSTGGNVGIGTSSPDEKLHIAGSIKIVDTTQQNGFVLTSNADGKASWAAASGNVSGPASSTPNAIARFNGATGKIIQNSGITVDDSTNVYTAGNVGIGRSSPQGKLHILSNSTTDPYVFVTSHTITGFGVVVSTGGKVGIGNQTPTAPLHVTKDDASVSSVTDLLILEHTTTGSPAANIGTGLVFNVEGTAGSMEQASIDTVLTSPWATTESADIVFNVRDNGTMAEVMRIRGVQSGVNQVNISGANVGIGTASPQALLDVQGGERFKTSALSVNTALTNANHTIFATTGAGGITLTLPAASVNTVGLIYYIYKVDSGAGALTIAPSGTNTINGVNASKTILTQWNGCRIVGSEATGWIMSTLTGA